MGMGSSIGHDALRKHLHERLEVQEPPKDDLTSIRIRTSRMIKALREVLQLCQPRLVMGEIRYGSKWQHPDLIDYIGEKLKKYQRTGNQEMLLDIVNLCVVEWKLSTHPQSHFKAEDRNG